ncbi:MAG: putative peptidoglycan glycosyltransferase FtsW [Victivallaceae bacterium]|nr:putative peptidoglycan glycosyltransferase FtsW [Victivallaceae bacterium]
MQNIHIPEQILEQYNQSPAEKSIFYACGMLVVVTFILLFGLTMLYSTSYDPAYYGTPYFKKQLQWAAAGLIFGIAAFVVGHKKLSEWSVFFMLLTIFLLAIADFCFPAVKGAHRWIPLQKVGIPANIQPSELAKIALALYLAKYCSANMRYINELFNLKSVIFFGICGFMIGLVLLGKDLGTTLLLVSVMALVLFVTGMRLRWLIPPAAVMLTSLFYLIERFDPERFSRLTSFMDPESCRSEAGYQLWNSLLAFGSGSWLGIGFGESRLKAKYLPEAHTDFILSIVGEELGLLALSLVIFAYLAFAWFALKISLNSRTRQGTLLGLALTTTIVLQAIINIGGVTGAFPTKGMPAPLISYVCTNLVMVLTAAGLLMSIAAETASRGFHEQLLESIKARLPFRKKE